MFAFWPRSASHDIIRRCQSEFVELRTRRDATLASPALILPAVQVNIRGGRLPPARRRAPLPQPALDALSAAFPPVAFRAW